MTEKLIQGFRDHRRSFEENVYVYPVLSRRSGGISVGINLNPDQRCNMDCVYCQVDRSTVKPKMGVDLIVLELELRHMLRAVTTGQLFEHPRFQETPPQLRRLNDVAFSGDGEPTTFKGFDKAVSLVSDLKSEMHLSDLKVVLITDSGCLHLDYVKRGLQLMDTCGGEIWAKLDAGTEAYYRRVNRTAIPFERVRKNLVATAAERPIVIQSMWMSLEGTPPSSAELEAYIGQIQAIEAVGTLKEIHLYTVARTPAESWVAPLTDLQLDAIGERVRAQARASVRVFYGG